MIIDKIESFGNSLLQHGSASDRVYLMKLVADDLPAILDHIDLLVKLHGYTKTFAKIPASHLVPFKHHGYTCEATVPGFYNGSEAGCFLAKYHSQSRQHDPDAQQVKEVLHAAKTKASAGTQKPLPTTVTCRLTTAADAVQMAELYRLVFASYPFPIHDPAYLKQTMAENVYYAGIWQDGRLLALASAEMDISGSNAEMTDFATRPQTRGQGFAQHLLHFLERQMPKEGIKTGYTIARATSFGMNITFSQSGYKFAGTLVQNTQISGGLESMNVWYKPLTNQ